MRIGLSRFTLGFLGGDLIGIFLGHWLHLPYYYFFILLLHFLVLSYIYYRRKMVLLIFISLIGFCLGLGSFNYFDQKESQKQLSYGKTQTFEVTVESSINKNNFQQIVAKYSSAGGRTKILIQTNLYPTYKYGDVLQVIGQIQDPSNIKFQGFDYGNYLFKKQVRGLVKNPDKITLKKNAGNKIIIGILKIGDKFQTVLNRLLPEPESTLMIGLIIGLKQQLPDSITTAFQRTGLSHVTAVSGYNVTIVVIWIAYLLTYISRRVVFPGAVFATIIFVIISGAGASVMRAGILAILILCGKFIGRKIYYPILILLVADIMLFFNPYMLKNDVSFQLSFLAFIGLMILSTTISENRYLEIVPEKIRQVLAETLGAQILVLPILIHNFGLVSIVAPLANILVLPLVPATMLLGFLTGLAGLIYIKAGILLANFTAIFLKYILIVVESFSKLGWAAVTLKTVEWWWIPIYYLLILMWLQYRPKQNE